MMVLLQLFLVFNVVVYGDTCTQQCEDEFLNCIQVQMRNPNQEISENVGYDRCATGFYTESMGALTRQCESGCTWTANMYVCTEDNDSNIATITSNAYTSCTDILQSKTCDDLMVVGSSERVRSNCCASCDIYPTSSDVTPVAPTPVDPVDPVEPVEPEPTSDPVPDPNTGDNTGGDTNQGEDTAEKPSVPTLCNALNEGLCDCGYNEGEGKATYTWWLQRTTNDPNDPVEEQRCFYIYHPAGYPVENTKVLAHMSVYSTNWRSVIHDEFVESADFYGIAQVGFMNNNQYVDWLNDGLVNDDIPTPCEDSDSMDIAYARVVLNWLRAEGYGAVYTKGFSQNALWSLMNGVCLRAYIEGIWQGGSGLSIKTEDPTSPGKESQCLQSDVLDSSIGKQRCTCDECMFAPVHPTLGFEEDLTLCSMAYTGDYLIESVYNIWERGYERHDIRQMIFPGGAHYDIKNYFPDWVVGCLGITESCSAECETSFNSCISAGDDFETCRDKIESGQLANCTPRCALTQTMLMPTFPTAEQPTITLSKSLWGSQRGPNANQIRAVDDASSGGSSPPSKGSTNPTDGPATTDGPASTDGPEPTETQEPEPTDTTTGPEPTDPIATSGSPEPTDTQGPEPTDGPEPTEGPTNQCEWMANDRHQTTDANFVGNVNSYTSCIALVRENCPTATIAQVEAGGVGRCNCIFTTAEMDPERMDLEEGSAHENCLMEEVDNPCVEPAGPLGPSIIANNRDCAYILDLTFENGETCESDGNSVSSTIPRGLTTVRETCPCSCRTFVDPVVSTDPPTTTRPATQAPEDVCEKVVDLTNMDDDTATFSTSGAGNQYRLSCGGNGEERIFQYLLQPGESLSIRQSSNNYDSRHELSIGTSCENRSTIVACVDDPDDQAMGWTNDRSTAMFAFFVVDAYSTGSGTFTLTWQHTTVTDRPTQMPVAMTTERPTQMPTERRTTQDPTEFRETSAMPTSTPSERRTTQEPTEFRETSAMPTSTPSDRRTTQEPTEMQRSEAPTRSMTEPPLTFCDGMVDLTDMQSPYRGSTGHAQNLYTMSCGGRGPDAIMKLTLVPGQTLEIGIQSDSYDSRHELKVGGECPGDRVLACVDDPDTRVHTYTNTGTMLENVYFIIDAYSTASGDFVLQWTLSMGTTESPTDPSAHPSMRTTSMRTTERPTQMPTAPRTTERPEPTDPVFTTLPADTDRCDSYVCDYHWNSLVSTVDAELNLLAAEAERLNRAIVDLEQENQSLRSVLGDLTTLMSDQQSTLDDLSRTSRSHQSAFECAAGATEGDMRRNLAQQEKLTELLEELLKKIE